MIGSIVVGLFACSPFEPEVEEFDDPEAEIRSAVAAAQIPSLAAWVVKDDEIVWELYLRYADVESGRPAGRQTAYTLASVSKLAVVTAVMQVEERGLIELQNDINDYVAFSVRNPKYPEDAITPYHLLTHTSGLEWPERDAVLPGFYDSYPEDTVPALAEWIPEFIQPGGSHYVDHVWRGSRPGEAEWYSNLGVALLAHLVEAVTGEDFDEYCLGHIFEPLGMTRTSYAYADLDPADVASHYGYNGRAIGRVRYRSYPSGGLKSSPEDFARFMIAYLKGGQYESVRVLDEETVDEILTIRNPASGQGLIWQRTFGGWLGHAGGMEGVAAYAEIHPERKLGVFLVSNSRTSLVYPGNKVHALVRRIAREYQ